MAPNTQQTKLHYPTFKESMVDAKQELLDAINACEQTRGMRGVYEACTEVMEDKYRIFESRLPLDFPERRWHVLIMGGMVASTKGDYQAATELDTLSMQFAGSDEQRAISLLNLSEDHRYAGRYSESLRNAKEAYALCPNHIGIAANLAISHAKTGNRETAQQIIRLFIASMDESDPNDMFAALATYDDEVQDLIPT